MGLIIIANDDVVINVPFRPGANDEEKLQAICLQIELNKDKIFENVDKEEEGD